MLISARVLQVVPIWDRMNIFYYFFGKFSTFIAFFLLIYWFSKNNLAKFAS